MLETENRNKWHNILSFVKERFSDGEEPDIDNVLFLIGVREFGQGPKKNSFKKDEKLELMHIAICRLLTPYGYYQLDGLDDDGWPHYTLVKKLPFLKAGEQGLLMKEAIIRYFDEEVW
jgi:hypothetical protein